MVGCVLYVFNAPFVGLRRDVRVYNLKVKYHISQLRVLHLSESDCKVAN